MSVKIWIRNGLCLLIVLLAGRASFANEVRVLDAQAGRASNGLYHFSVTLLHADNGWGHYADRWQVLAPDGTVLATRVLMHPHDQEQPFTRAMSGIAIPDGIAWVNVRGHDKVHGYGSRMLRVDIPAKLEAVK